MKIFKAKPLVLTLLLLSGPALAETTLFKVTRGGDTVFVGGTLHLLRPSDFPLPEEFDHAFDRADKVFFETDLDAVNSPAFGQAMAQSMMYPEGKTLASELDPDVWRQVQSYSEENKFPIQQFMQFNPALVSIVMTVTETQKLGLGAGVDEHYYDRAKEQNKPTGELETTEDVIGYMEAMAAEDGNKVMESTLRDMAALEEMIDDATSAWRGGHIKRLHKEMGQLMHEEYPSLYQTLLVDRNMQWLPRIEAMFDEPGTELVLVGSLHLAGPDSVLELLKDKGFSVKSYRVPPE